jgi:hypothetical protein
VHDVGSPIVAGIDCERDRMVTLLVKIGRMLDVAKIYALTALKRLANEATAGVR